MSEVLFFIAGTGAIAGAMGVVVWRNPFYTVLALVFHLVCLAALFLLLRAEFIAAAQVVVYAGAVMVLYVFVVSYIGGRERPLASAGPALRTAAPLFAGALLVELCVAVLGSGLTAIGDEGAHTAVGFGSPAQIGQLLLTKFLLAFEVASYLLLVAAVAAVILARRRAGLEGQEPEGKPFISVLRPVGTGTTAEAAGRIQPLPPQPPEEAVKPEPERSGSPSGGS